MTRRELVLNLCYRFLSPEITDIVRKLTGFIIVGAAYLQMAANIHTPQAFNLKYEFRFHFFLAHKWLHYIAYLTRAGHLSIAKCVLPAPN